MSGRTSSTENRKPQRRAWAAAGLVLLGAAGLMLWLGRGKPAEVAGRAGGSVQRDAEIASGGESFQTLCQVLASGGGPLNREAAVAWLDRITREHRPLPAEAEAKLLGMLASDGHPDWSAAYRQQIFNSACNALRADSGVFTESFVRILLAHATAHPDRVLRLYALQHIDSLRRDGDLEGALADEIHRSLQVLAADPESDVAGTAILLLAGWEDHAAAASPAVLELAVDTAADVSRPVDIRVSALHSAGPRILDTARAIAVNTAEPAILRKAAIARIGRHGGATDLPVLADLRTESTRLAQAADPAIEALRMRLRNPNAPAPIPYPASSIPTISP